MSKKVDYSGLSQLDANLKKYFSSYMAPSIVNAKKRVNAEIANERKKYVDEYNTTVAAMAMPKTVRGLAPVADHNANGKTTQDPAGGVIRKVRDAWSKNKKIQEDIETFKVHFFQELLKRYPQKDINQLVTFADDYVNSRINQLVIEQMARSGVPKNSIDYCIKNGLSDSLIGTIFSNFTYKSADHNAKVRDKANAMYNPSWKERVGANAIAMGVDAASLGGVGGVKSVMLDASLRGGIELYNIKKWNDEEYKRDVSKKVLGDKDGIKKIQEGAEKYKRTATEKMYQLNFDLKNKIKENHSSFSNRTSNSMNKFYQQNKGNADKLYNNIKTTFTKQAVPFNKDSFPPKWMMTMSRKRCEQTASGFYAIAMEMSRTGKENAVVHGKKMTYKEVCQRAIDYAKTAAIKEAEEKERIRQHSQKKTETAERRAYHEEETSQKAVTNTEVTTQKPQAAPQQSGWEEAMKEMGAGEFGGLSKNFGYIMAMLPDMIIGMFTGKNPDLKIEDNLLPLASIAAGLLVKRNPLLKMILLGYGGLNIFSSAGTAALKQRNGESAAKTYRTYADESLSPRIANPVVKGRSMVADIDGVPTVIEINKEVIEAYEKGHIPLNTLANAVLTKYDENRNVAAQHYEHGMSQQQDEQQTMHIK